MGRLGRGRFRTLRGRRRGPGRIPPAAIFAFLALILINVLSPLFESTASGVLSGLMQAGGAAETLLGVELRLLPDKKAEETGSMDGAAGEAGEAGGKQPGESPAPGEADLLEGGSEEPEIIDVDNVPAAGTDGEFFEQPMETWADPAGILQMMSAKPIAAITIAPADPKGYVESQGIYIKNNTGYTVDIDASLKKKLAFSLKGSGPHVLVMHTHGSESFSEEGKSYYLPEENNRSTDNKKNIVSVGEKVAGILKSKGIGTVHLTGLFDYPEYSGAYTRALEAISSQMKKTPSVKVVLDIHRDAMETAAGVKYKTVTEIGGKDAAQIMLVVGTDAGGLPHGGWAENLRFAIRLQSLMNRKYPGLMRPITLRTERFNQHVTQGGSLLIEMGTSGNTLEEAQYSAELLAGVLGDLLKTQM